MSENCHMVYCGLSVLDTQGDFCLFLYVLVVASALKLTWHYKLIHKVCEGSARFLFRKMEHSALLKPRRQFTRVWPFAVWAVTNDPPHHHMYNFETLYKSFPRGWFISMLPTLCQIAICEDIKRFSRCFLALRKHEVSVLDSLQAGCKWKCEGFTNIKFPSLMRGKGAMAKAECETPLKVPSGKVTICYWTWPLSSLIYPLNMVIINYPYLCQFTRG